MAEINDSITEETKDSENRINIRISVRNLVEFILRSGDLDNRRGSAAKEAMQQGGRLHRKIQGRMGSEYEAEVSLKYLVKRPRFHILIEGRADGILTEDQGVTVDEIKAVYKDITLMTKPVDVHLAQAKCYAYIYAMQNSLDEIRVRMTYVQIETEQIRYFHEAYSKEALEAWFTDVITEYEKWAAFQADWIQIRAQSVQKLQFPFAYRPQQKELVKGVYRTIEQRKRLFIQASTGVGKTISALYPAVQALGRKMADKIFYLTAKTITRTVAVETIELLAGQELQLKAIVLTAKEKICFQEAVACNPQACSYAKGHFDRVNDCTFALLTRENMITSELIEQYAREYRVCPFELSLDVSIWVDVIICDYNYVFNYDVCLKRFFGETVKEDYIFLIDEAHNLVDRGREMYSAQIYKEEILEIKRQVKYYSRSLEKLLEKCNRKMLEWKRQCEQYDQMPISELGDFPGLLAQLMTKIDTFLEEEEDAEIRDAVLDFYFKIRHFLNIYDGLDDHYVIYREYEEGHFKVRLFCVDPSTNLNLFLEHARATIFFSATFLPISYYKELLSGDMQDYTMYARSSFPDQNRLLLVAGDVSSRYARRNENEYTKIAEYVECLLQSREGNYLIFLPSYAYMMAVYEIFQTRNPQVYTIVQSSHMTEVQREEFLREFQRRQGGMAAFCVLGGIFSEGIDLAEESLIGAVIVGTGMPQIGTEREILRRYFQEREGTGFDYAFRYPGFHKIMQAAGRVIRTERDRGVILLLEERLLGNEYHALYPREWGNIRICNRTNVLRLLDEFWHDNKR